MASNNLTISNSTSVLGFPIDGIFNADGKEYTLDMLESLHPKYLYDLACERTDTIIYDNLNDFFKDLNSDLIDTENMYWLMA